MNKSRMLSFRVEKSDEETINNYLNEHGIKMRSPFIREALFDYMNSDKPQLRRVMLDEFSKLRRELTNVGNNLNQVAYHLNSNHPVSTTQLTEAQECLQGQFAQMVRFYRRIEDDLRQYYPVYKVDG